MYQNLSEEKLENLLKIAKKAALQAGEKILQYFQQDKLKVNHKQDQSPVTRADKEANRIILNELKRTGIPILSEETNHQPFEVRKSWDACWIVDPLDGTKEFIKGLSEFTVNIGLVVNGKPVLGVVFAPALDEIYCGSSGTVNKAAWQEINGQKLGLKVSNQPKASKIAVSRSHLSEETKSFIEKLNPEAEIISAGSSLKFMLIAKGTAEAYPRYTPSMEWDTAAAHAIVNAAGGKVLQLLDPKKELIYNKKSLTNPALFAVNNEALLRDFKQ